MNLKNEKITEDTLHGMFDADGNIATSIEKRKRKGGFTSVNVTWTYDFCQCSANRYNTVAIADFLHRKSVDRRRLTGREAGKIVPSGKGTMKSDSGQMI